MADRQSETERNIRAFLLRRQWISGDCEVEFLAAGEYNENFLVRTPGAVYLFRINHGTQLGLDDQISYEFDVLQAVHPSGVTPEPLRLCKSDELFPRGVMLMEYIRGIAFSYERNWQEAAGVFAAVHRLQPPDTLIRQPFPIAAIVNESRGLLSRHRRHPLPEVGRRIARYAAHIADVGREADLDLAGETQCIVNTEVNSGNFIAPEPGSSAPVKLVDWEKAVVSSRCQDLAHFVVPTTTLWKSEFRFSPSDRRSFLEQYCRTALPNDDVDEIDRRTAIMERTIVLRALSWCYMAYAEYMGTERPLRNEDTFRRIEYYLENAESFIEA